LGVDREEQMEKQSDVGDLEIGNVAEDAIVKAKEAIDNCMKKVNHLYHTVDGSADSVQTTARQMNRKAAEFAERNMNTSIEFARQLVRAKDVQEMAAIQQRFLQT
jgi:hypothetical protein